jgi:hypothetical protein
MTITVYPNPNCKKIRSSHILAVNCAHYKTFIANYQKVGESNLVKLYNERIIDGTMDFSQHHGAILCPNCNERIAPLYKSLFSILHLSFCVTKINFYLRVVALTKNLSNEHTLFEKFIKQIFRLYD